MLGMASPTGFLDLSQQAVTGAAEVGTGQVGGVPVTEYTVSIDLSQLAQVPGITSDEATTIQDRGHQPPGIRLHRDHGESGHRRGRLHP